MINICNIYFLPLKCLDNIETNNIQFPSPLRGRTKDEELGGSLNPLGSFWRFVARVGSFNLNQGEEQSRNLSGKNKVKKQNHPRMSFIVKTSVLLPLLL